MVGVVAIIGVSCASNTSNDSDKSSTAVAHVASTTPSSVASSAQPFGHHQTATGPGGQGVTALAGTPERVGYTVNGPPGSWAMGMTIKNLGPGSFGWDPATQITLLDSSGKNNAPLVSSAAIATTGKPTTVAAGQQIPVVLVFVLASGVKPKRASFAPFGPSITPIQWSS